MQVKDRKVRKYSIKEVEPLINSLIAIYGSEKEVCKRLGYNEGYVSQLRSREESEKTPQVSFKFYNQLKALQNARPSNVRDSGIGHGRDAPVSLDELRDYIIGIWADVIAGRQATLKSLERIEGRNEGELNADADRLVIQIQDRLVRMRKGIVDNADRISS